jgi:MFS transporter, SHS family, sialic acid transporter
MPTNSAAELSNTASPRITGGQWLTLAAAFLGWMFDGFEIGLFPLVARPALTDLLGENNSEAVGPWISIMIAVFLVGAASGGVVFGWLGDRIGRVRAMTLSVLTYAVFMGLCGLATSPLQVFVLRFFSSLGMGGEWSLGVALVMEIWPNKTRGLLAGLIGAAANVGFLLIAVIGLGLGKIIGGIETWLLDAGVAKDTVAWLVGHSGWRLMMFVGAMPALLTFLIRIFVPESERWLHEKKQGTTSHWATHDLIAVLIGSLGPLGMIYLWRPGTDVPFAWRVAGTVFGLALALVGYTFPVLRYLQRSHLAEGSRSEGPRTTLNRMLLAACLSGVALLGTWGSVQFASPWADKIVERDGLKNGLDTATLNRARSDARAYTQICSGMGAIVGTIAAALLGNAIGRRITYTLLCAGSLAASLVFFLGNTGYGTRFLVTVFIAGGLTASFYGWLPLYLPELFRSRVRATGQGFGFNFGRILAAIGALQTGSLIALFSKDVVWQLPGLGEVTLAGGYPLACSTMSLIYVVGVFIIWLAPETLGKPLPD